MIPAIAPLAIILCGFMLCAFIYLVRFGLLRKPADGIATGLCCVGSYGFGHEYPRLVLADAPAYLLLVALPVAGLTAALVWTVFLPLLKGPTE